VKTFTMRIRLTLLYAMACASACAALLQMPSSKHVKYMPMGYDKKVCTNQTHKKTQTKKLE